MASMDTSNAAPAINGAAYPITDHTFDVVVIGAGPRAADDAPVASVMTTDVIAVRQSVALSRAAELMLKHRHTALPVVEPDGRLVGLVSEADGHVVLTISPTSSSATEMTVDYSTANGGPGGSGDAAALAPLMSSATSRPQTAASSRELEASRLAPCRPVQATSPAAHSPATLVRPSLSTLTPPIW